MNRAFAGGILFAAVVMTAAGTDAHTLASTIVSVTMTHADEVNITIAAEADPLISKLEALAAMAALEPPTSLDERRARIESLLPTLRAHIDARANDTPVLLELRDVAVDDTAQAEIHLAATIQPGSSFTWKSTFIFGAYQLAITSGDTAERLEWLQGPQTSTPVALEAPRAETALSAPGLTRIGHGLSMAALVVYVFGRRRAARS